MKLIYIQILISVKEGKPDAFFPQKLCCSEPAFSGANHQNFLFF
jgi:hypothetical protein